MKHYYKQYAMKLFENGYFPIPIRPFSKVPFLCKGESWKIKITADKINEWALGTTGAGGIALTKLSAIDFDITNTIVCSKIIKELTKIFPEKKMLIRTGQPPKFLVPCHENSDIKSKWKNTWYDKKGIKQEIEFLSPDGQYFMVYGIHPDTKKDFMWDKEDGPLSIKACDLDVWDTLDIAQVEDVFDRICYKEGFTPAKTNKENTPTTNNNMQAIKISGEKNNNNGLLELTAWTNCLTAEWRDDREKWILIGSALHHETAGSSEGWQVFDSWSKISDKYTGRMDTMNRWESFKSTIDGGKCVTGATIVHALQECGKWEKAKGKVKEKVNNQTDTSNDEYEKIVSKLNEKHAVIRINSKIRILTESQTADHKLYLGFLSLTDFRLLYSNKKVQDPLNLRKKKPISQIWLDSNNRRQYDGIVFEPDGGTRKKEDLDRYYNLWKGLPVTPNKGDWGLFKNHIYNVIADGNKKIGDWIVAWIARIVQKPGGRRPGTCIVMQGGQGTGKGVFVNIVGKLFGQHFMPVSHAAQVIGRFNSHLTNKILVFIDEGFWAGDKKAEGVLKSMITEPIIAIEQKGVDIIQIKNNINIIIASNNDWVVPANMAERRFCVLKINEEQQGNAAYFSKVVDQMTKQGGLEGMLFDLLHLDISNINLTKFEQTQGLFEQKIHNMTTHMEYWFERLQEGDLLYGNDENVKYDEFLESSQYGGQWYKVKSKLQYEEYLMFASNMKEQYPLSPTQFGLFLKKICPYVVVFKKRQGNKRDNWRKFPTIAECRDEFDLQYNTKFQWLDMNVEETTV